MAATKDESTVMSLDEDYDQRMLRLKAMDGSCLEVRRTWAMNASKTIFNALESSPEEDELEISVETQKCLASTIRLIDLFQGGPVTPPESPLRSKDLSTVVDEKADAFLAEEWKDKANFYNLILVACNLEMRGYLELLCAKMASTIKGQPLDKIKGILTPDGYEPATEESDGKEPAGDEPAGDEPDGDEPTGDEPTGEEEKKKD